MLPPELLSLVCSYATKPTLKAMRHVCKSHEQAASPYLFDQIFLSNNAADMRIAKLFAIRFKHYIRTLVFSSNYYKDLDEDDFHDEFHYYEGIGEDEDIEAEIAHVEYAYELHLHTRKMQKETFRSEGCDLVFEHLEYSRSSGFGSGGINNPWRVVLLGLIAANSTVKELTMEPQDQEVPTNTAAFKLSAPELRDAKLFFEALTRLRLSLATDCERYTAVNGESYFVNRNVPKLLRAARNLEYLSIDAEGDEKCSFQGVFGPCKFPNLKSLILACHFESTEANLKRIFECSRKLEHLTIICHTLTSSSWARLVDWIKVSLPLKTVALNQLYGGFEGIGEIKEYMDVFNDVDAFFFGEGDNPFTAEEIERYEADRASKREMIDPTGGDFIARILMFH